MTSLYLATPTTRDFSPLYVASVLYMDKPDEMFYDWTVNLPVSMARNLLVERFLQSEADYLLFADSDATWAPAAVTRLIERGRMMITACIYRRKLPPLPTMGYSLGEDEQGFHVYDIGALIDELLKWVKRNKITDDVINQYVSDVSDISDVIPLDGCGMHFCLIHRSVFKEIEKPYFKDWSGAGEDFYFCRKVKEAGIQLFADLSVHTGHLAGTDAEFGLREFLSYQRLISKARKDLRLEMR